MKLINTDGMALIGPGSEWFWTAVSGLVLSVTFIAIYRQLRLQRSASALEQARWFSREWSSERLLRHQLELTVALQEGRNPANPPVGAATAIGFWEDLGTLARSGHLDRRLLWEGGDCQRWLGAPCTLGPSGTKGYRRPATL